MVALLRLNQNGQTNSKDEYCQINIYLKCSILAVESSDNGVKHLRNQFVFVYRIMLGNLNLLW